MFDRLLKLISLDDLKLIGSKKVLLVGLGGVGGACFEALVRMGITNITIVDNDVFDISNLNRQLLSNRNNIGHSKVNEAILRAKALNPDICIKSYEMFLNEANFNEIEDFNNFDYVIDCCDTVSTKILLIKEAINNNIKIISSMGTGNRIDASKLVITDIAKTSYDPLAKSVRKKLREEKIYAKVPVVTSTEIPSKSSDGVIGSSVFVPNVAGFYIANYIFNDIISSRRD